MKKQLLIWLGTMLILIVVITVAAFVALKKMYSVNEDELVTLNSMRAAAEEAGYLVEDGYMQAWSKDVVQGFTVMYSSNTTPVLEYKDKETADAIAKREMNGYNFPIQNGKFLTFASAIDGVVQDKDEEAFLQNLIYGRPL